MSRQVGAERAARRVDRGWGPVCLLRLTPAIAMLIAGCAAGTVAMGTADPEVESRLETATAPARRAQVTFDWNMTDRDARFSGRGVLRIEGGYRARVDLFGPRGETLAAAIVDNANMRVAPDGAASMLPPPALLWASLGVFRRPTDAPLTGTAIGSDAITLAYARDNTRWNFGFETDRLRSAEWTDGSGRRTVALTGNADGFPGQALFRDWAAFRELALQVTDVEERATFEPDVWILPGER